MMVPSFYFHHLFSSARWWGPRFTFIISFPPLDDGALVLLSSFCLLFHLFFYFIIVSSFISSLFHLLFHLRFPASPEYINFISRFQATSEYFNFFITSIVWWWRRSLLSLSFAHFISSFLFFILSNFVVFVISSQIYYQLPIDDSAGL